MSKKPIAAAPMNEEEKNALFADDEQVNRLIDRAERGEKDALALMAEYMQREPLWVKHNDIAANAERALITHILGENRPFVKEIFQTRQLQLREELAGKDTTPLEGLLIRRIALCWLQAYHADMLFAQYAKEGLKGTEYIQRYQDRAHKRLLSAIKALAQVQRLKLPMVQVNIGEKQVNVQDGAQ